MDRTDLAAFLHRRCEALQPEDVGMPRGRRRRTPGLRREEVAALCGMSTDYYSRLERGRGPQPSEQMLTSIARGFHLTLDERDHLFLLAGHNAPARAAHSDHVNAGMMRILDRQEDTPAQVVTGTGETIIQTPLAAALLGDQTRFTGPARSLFYRWFTDPDERAIYPPDDHPMHSRVYVARLRSTAAREGRHSRAAALAAQLNTDSPEFAALWAQHEVGMTYTGPKRIIHPQVGTILLYCQILVDPDQSQSLLVFTAMPGSEDYDKLRLHKRPGIGSAKDRVGLAWPRQPCDGVLGQLGSADPFARLAQTAGDGAHESLGIQEAPDAMVARWLLVCHGTQQHDAVRPGIGNGGVVDEPAQADT